MTITTQVQAHFLSLSTAPGFGGTPYKAVVCLPTPTCSLFSWALDLDIFPSAADRPMQVEAGLLEGGRRRRSAVAAVGPRNGARIVSVRNRGAYHRRPMRRSQAVAVPATAVQRLFEACKAVFKEQGTVPAPCDVRMVQRLLDNMTLEDVRLSKELPFFKYSRSIGGVSGVTVTTIYKCDNFSMCILFLPATASIPLHNHPGMTVFSKLLHGSMRIKSYDWVDPSESKLAKLVVDSEFTAPCDTSVLYPTTGGNIHTFAAITPCAVLDVMGPPYGSSKDGRDCTYYRDQPCPTLSEDRREGEAGDRYAWLEEIDVRDSFNMSRLQYLGPPIVDGC